MATTTPSPKQQFLEAYDREHATTMRVLRAYPKDKLNLRPHAKSKTARELAWVFVLECGLGTKVYHDEFAKRAPAGKPPEPPESWQEILVTLERANQDFRNLISSTPDEKLFKNVHFFTGPKTMGEISRLVLPGFSFQTRSIIAANSRYI